MYIVIKKFRSESVEKSIEDARTRFLPLVSQMPGFISYNLVKSGDSTTVSILSFNSKLEADASTTASTQWIKENNLGALYQLEELITGEVVVKG